ncbi:phosphonate metabolism transcriptional regulator PhnF [Solimicrobium silvestre]|uniref:Phosphonate metabolism transcriptional regulator PhnF n=1 Tax=Solimicrobium silvestre TaxID=2099400 RepID=A0A2S9GYI3_9BURK|nr:phosphonate metabolism transcriptional regulator PhnF [Solimicrobium silvestre]PRC92779.1 Phosphonate metabolism transcriptional regulator PhnF [Solimicrobium silvestre]
MTNKKIDRSAGNSIWRQIEDALSADILSGSLTHRLPNEATLAERFNVNRHTVRQAVKALVERGMVDVVHGSGTFVRDNIIDYQLGRRTRLAHSLAKSDRVGKSQVFNWAVIKGGEGSENVEIAEVLTLLDLPFDASVLAVESLDIVDGNVISVCKQYFPLPRFAGLGEIYTKTGITHLALSQFGVHSFQRRMSRVSARLPDREVAQQLAQPSTFPILYVETVYVDENQQAIEYGISQFNSAAIQIVIEPD